MNKKEVASELNLTAIRNIPEINPGDDLSQIINGCLTDQSISLKDKDVLIIAQKIISKSEDRFIDLKTVDPSEKAIEVSKKTDKDPRLVELILQESCEIIRAEKGILVVEHKLGTSSQMPGLIDPILQDQTMKCFCCLLILINLQERSNNISKICIKLRLGF